MLAMTLRPFKYLFIRHHEKKWFDFIIPLIMAGVFSYLYSLLNKPFPLTANGGLIPQIISLLQMLIGFYIASLAAIATFGNQSIDEVMAGEAPTLRIKERGVVNTVPLTRRRFLCYLFGYLALLSIFLYLTGVGSMLVGLSSVEFMDYLKAAGLLTIAKSIYLFVYLFFLINLILTTLLGLYYLSVRIHESN